MRSGLSSNQDEPPDAASPADLLGEGNVHQLAGRLREAAECFAQVVDSAATHDDVASGIVGLRLLGIVHHLQGETRSGIHYCRRSREIALASAQPVLAAEATMALANMSCDQGRIAEARDLYRIALELAPHDSPLVARVEQNLGILESVQGNLDAALGHYRAALHAHETNFNVLGRARAHHNIGMIHADRREWSAAEWAYEQASSLAQQAGDFHLTGLCHLNRAEIDMAHERYAQARGHAEAAAATFARLGARVDLADAFRMLGGALRHLKHPTLAESRLRSALDIATTAGVPLAEAESCRDIAGVLVDAGRRDEALQFMDRSVALFERIGAARDATDVAARRTALLAA